MRIILFLIVTFFAFTNTQAQISFEKNYDSTSTYSSAIVNTNDGGYFFAINFDTLGSRIIKTDSLGDTLWTKNYSRLFDYIEDAIQSSDGNYIINTYSSVIKFDSVGDILWNRKINTNGRRGLRGIAEDNQGKIVVIGDVFRTPPYCCNALVVRLNSNGVIDSSFNHNISNQAGDFNVRLHDIIVDFDGNYIISSDKFYKLTTPKLGLIKIDTSGSVLWDRLYTNLAIDGARNIIQIKDSSFLMVGLNGYTPSPVKLYAVDKNGLNLTTRLYNSDTNKLGWPRGVSIASTIGGYYLSGSNNQIYLMKLDTNFNFLWSRSFGGPSEANMAKMISTKDGGAAIVGASKSFSNTQDAYFIKTNTLGLITQIRTNIVLNQNRLKFYPNPTQGLITIPESVDIKNIQVYNLGGQKIQEVSPNPLGEIQIRLEGPKGIYLIQLQKTDGSVESAKVVKQ